ncbi:MAG: TIGR03564 family F420-dependent LLM class oxidoreductase [Actinomycetota bacterium]
MKLSLFSFAESTEKLVSLAGEAKEQGFDTLWLPQIFGPDALTAIAVAGTQVPDITFGTSVIPTYPRHPQMLAQQALTVTQAIGDRLILGIGPSHKPVVEGMWGISFDKPIRHVREYLECLGPLLTEKSVRFAGESLTTRADVEVDGPAPKVMVAALGPQLLKVTGRLADGTILWMTGPATIRDHTIPTISAAAEEAGRPSPAIVAAFPVCVTDGSDQDRNDARERAAKEFMVYGQLPSYRAMLDREGFGGPEDLAIIGGAGEVEERIRALDDIGVTTFAAAEFGNADQRGATRDLLVSML